MEESKAEEAEEVKERESSDEILGVAITANNSSLFLLCDSTYISIQGASVWVSEYEFPLLTCHLSIPVWKKDREENAFTTYFPTDHPFFPSSCGFIFQPGSIIYSNPIPINKIIVFFGLFKLWWRCHPH